MRLPVFLLPKAFNYNNENKLLNDLSLRGLLKAKKKPIENYESQLVKGAAR